MNLTHPHRPTPPRRPCAPQPGFASLLTVISVGIGLLLILISMYRDTVESQNTQKDHALRADYQQREEAFLRALTNIIPNKAMLCMQNDSRNWSTRKNLDWSTIFDEAMVLSNANAPLDSSKSDDLGLPSARNANIANSTFSYSATIKNLDGESSTWEEVTTGTNVSASSEYPPPLTCSNRNNRWDGRYPLVSHKKTYGDSATGWVGADVDDYPQYNLVDSPAHHFNYRSGSTMIAKHNWWGFELSFADEDSAQTKLASRKKKYLISLYEIPSQLPINGASYTALGQHTDGSDWSNFNISGGIFAERVKTEGSFSTEAISSRKSVELSGDTSVNGITGSTTGSDPFASTARELSETKGETFPISSAANGGRVAFIPINRGLDFYDRFMGDDRDLGNGNSPDGTNAVSQTSWDYYSLGSQQCVMRLDIIDVESSLDQTPTSIRFTYADKKSGNSLAQETFTKGSNWPDIGTEDGTEFPFHVETSAAGYPCLSVYVERIQPFLAARGADYPETNNSISINPDYVNNAKISRPTFPSSNDKLALLLMDAQDLTTYTAGFSLVTNLRLIIADDVNTTPTTAPSDMTLASGELFYPPLSLFAPEKRYGDSLEPMQIEVDGQLGSLAKDNDTPTHIGDFKSGSSDEVVPANISADLKAITHPAALPPINIMNWMVLIREIHPTYTP
ncbi:hypothetical protein JIN77_06505 [Verrucomicrobiaceae bacterium R5-34]|nr:hypothetical protein [Verrucomicrobiaceae bacterium R5-34]